jgi:hypothetical protein
MKKISPVHLIAIVAIAAIFPAFKPGMCLELAQTVKQKNNMAVQMGTENKNIKADNEDRKTAQPVGSGVKQEAKAPADKLAVYREEYGDFIKKLKLSEDKNEELLNLIRWVDTMFTGHEDTTIETWALLPYDKNIKGMREFYADRELKDFLGTKDYAAFLEYQKSSSERSIVNGFIGLFGKGINLDDQKKEKMIQAMYAAREQFESNPQTDDNHSLEINTAPSDYEPTSLEKAYLASVNGILSKAGIKRLKEYFKNRNKNSISVPLPDDFN